MDRIFQKTFVAATVVLVGAGVLAFLGKERPKDAAMTVSISNSADTANPVDAADAIAPVEHPLLPAIRQAKAGLAVIDETIQDYTATLVKRESIDGTLGEHQYISVKVRHVPFSVYMFFLSPDEIKGRECIYVAGQNDGKLVAHEGGRKISLPTVRINPKGPLAMKTERYPITEFGIRNLSARLIEVGERDAQFGECELTRYEGTRVGDRECTCLQITHPVPRAHFRYHLARVFIDNEQRVPVRFESYDWPAPGQKPPLLEEYTYMQLKFNVGLTDADFTP